MLASTSKVKRMRLLRVSPNPLLLHLRVTKRWSGRSDRLPVNFITSRCEEEMPGRFHGLPCCIYKSCPHLMCSSVRSLSALLQTIQNSTVYTCMVLCYDRARNGRSFGPIGVFPSFTLSSVPISLTLTLIICSTSTFWLLQNASSRNFPGLQVQKSVELELSE